MKRYIRAAVKDISNDDVYIRYTEAQESKRGNVLSRLAEDPDERVREQVAANPNTPLNILQKLAHDPYTLVRKGVTINPNAPVYLILSTANSMSNYSGKVEFYIEVDYDSVEALGMDEVYRQISLGMSVCLDAYGYAMYSDTINPSGDYYCRCGKFDTHEDAIDFIAGACSYIAETYPDICIVSQDVEMLLG